MNFLPSLLFSQLYVNRCHVNLIYLSPRGKICFGIQWNMYQMRNVAQVVLTCHLILYCAVSTERVHILKQTCNWKLQVCLYVTFYWIPGTKEISWIYARGCYIVNPIIFFTQPYLPLLSALYDNEPIFSNTIRIQSVVEHLALQSLR